MYIENGVEKLSKAQISKLLNGHRVRIKKGQGDKLHLTEEHSKKLHKAHMKGAGITMQLDPYAIASNQHLRQARDAFRALMGGTALIDQQFTTRQAVNATGNFFKNPGKTLGFGARGGTLLIDEPITARQVVNSTGNFFKNPAGTLGFGFEGSLPSPDRNRVPPIPTQYRGRGRPPKAMTGSGPKGLKKFKKWTGAIGDFLKPVAKPILGALTDQAVNNINAYGNMSASQAGSGIRRRGRPPKQMTGSGPKGLKKFQKWTGAIGDFLKPVAKPILGALTDQAVNNINAYGNMSASQAGRGIRSRGRPRKGGAALPPGTPYGIY